MKRIKRLIILLGFVILAGLILYRILEPAIAEYLEELLGTVGCTGAPEPVPMPVN